MTPVTREAVLQMEDTQVLLQISTVQALQNAMFLDVIIILQRAATPIAVFLTQINVKIVIATSIEMPCIVCLAYMVPQTKIIVPVTNAIYAVIMHIKNMVAIITVPTALNL